MGTLLLPRVYPLTLGVASAIVIPANPSRTGLIFLSGSQGNNIAFCPAFLDQNAASPAALAAVVNGPGSYTLIPGGFLDMTGKGCTCAWAGIASGGGTPAAIWEF